MRHLLLYREKEMALQLGISLQNQKDMPTQFRPETMYIYVSLLVDHV